MKGRIFLDATKHDDNLPHWPSTKVDGFGHLKGKVLERIITSSKHIELKKYFKFYL